MIGIFKKKRLKPELSCLDKDYLPADSRAK